MWLINGDFPQSDCNVKDTCSTLRLLFANGKLTCRN